jgi:signal peptidase I
VTRRSLHAVAWVLLVVTALLLWPQRWGGSMTYVITSGTSMQPGFVAGDLAVLRAAGAYQVGDVAAYRSTEIKKIVMHRITEVGDGVYRFQGDDNDFVDPDRVTDEQMLGRLVLRVPKAGMLLRWFVEPLHLAVAALGVMLLFSDRRPRATAAAPPTPAQSLQVLQVRCVDVPTGTVVAHVSDRAQLDVLAERCGRPVLHERTGDVRWVHDGAVLYRHALWDDQQLEERRGAGRDWQYDVDSAVPRPRRLPPHDDRPRRRSRKAGVA